MCATPEQLQNVEDLKEDLGALLDQIAPLNQQAKDLLVQADALMEQVRPLLDELEAAQDAVEIAESICPDGGGQPPQQPPGGRPGLWLRSTSADLGQTLQVLSKALATALSLSARGR